MEKENTQESLKALETLISAAKIANKRGAFELEESEAIANAVKFFLVPKQDNGSDKSTGTEPAGEDKSELVSSEKEKGE